MRKVNNLKINEKLLNEVIESKNKDMETIKRIESGTFPLIDEFEVAYFHRMKNFLNTMVASKILKKKI